MNFNKHGGKRANSGRRKGSNIYSESTKPIRIPISMIDKVKKYALNKGYAVPLYSNKIQAGFPSPADDHIESRIDFNEFLVQHPSSTFAVKVTGESMIEAGIYPDDTLIVDRSIEPNHGKVVVAVIDGELTVKRLHRKDGQIILLPENRMFDPIIIKNENDLVIWGVVTNVIHKV
ncbi:MAG: translesion error-prone DNA polymerase V autoproteolytic subunit [Rickettsiales bacterium]